MVGLPGENLEQMWKTVKMNIDIKTDYPWCAIFQPFAGTELGDYARQTNFIEDKSLDESTSYFQLTSIKSDHEREVINLQKLFFYAVKLLMQCYPFLQKYQECVVFSF